MCHANIKQHTWQLVQTHRSTLTICDDRAQPRAIPLSEIAGYGMFPCEPNGDGGRVDVILLTGDRLLIESSHAHKLVQILDTRLG